MLIYFLIFLLLVVLSLIYDFSNSRRGKTFSKILVFIVFTLFAGLRYRLGLDSIHYEEGYESLPTLTKIFQDGVPVSRYGLGWTFFVALLKEISTDFLVLQFVQAVIVNAVVLRYFHKQTVFFFLASIFYFGFTFLYFNTEILRESLSIVIFLSSLKYFKGKIWLKYYSFVIVAILFHFSALICLLFPFVRLLKMKRFFVAKIAMIFLLFAILWSYLAESLVVVFFSGSEISSRLDIYLSDEYVYNLNGIILSLLTYVLLPFYLITSYKNHLFAFPVGYYLVLLQLLIGFMVLFNSVLFLRFSNYLTIPVIGYFVNILYMERKSRYYRFKLNKIIILLFLYLMPRFYSYMREEYQDVYFYDRYFPYTSVSDKERVYNRELLYDYSKQY